MPTLEDFRNEILFPIKDKSITSEFVDAKINECLTYLARNLLFPDLESSGVFLTEVGKAEVDIPVNWLYSRNLFHASLPNKAKIKVLSAVGLLINTYPNYDTELETGDITHVTTRGSKIVYYPIPLVATTVTCKFYKKPTLLTSDTAVPTFLPDEMQNDLIVNYALWKIWARLEDGIEGIKVNTTYHKNEFKTYFEELDDSIDSGQSRPDPERPDADSFGEGSWI